MLGRQGFDFLDGHWLPIGDIHKPSPVEGFGFSRAGNFGPMQLVRLKYEQRQISTFS
jgi:hypothetical protein